MNTTNTLRNDDADIIVFQKCYFDIRVLLFLLFFDLFHATWRKEEFYTVSLKTYTKYVLFKISALRLSLKYSKNVTTFSPDIVIKHNIIL